MSDFQAYQDKLSAKMEKVKAEISKLAAEAKDASADKKIEYQHKMDALKAEHSDTSEKLEELKLAGEAKWEELKAGMSHMVNSMKH